MSPRSRGKTWQSALGRENHADGIRKEAKKKKREKEEKREKLIKRITASL